MFAADSQYLDTFGFFNNDQSMVCDWKWILQKNVNASFEAGGADLL